MLPRHLDSTYIDPEKVTRLFKAFKRTYGPRSIARQNFTCCQSCGSAAISEKLAPGEVYLFYHRQDAEYAWGTFRTRGAGVLYLAYGRQEVEGEAKGVDEAATLKIGQTIAKLAEEVGLGVEWDGTAATRVLIMEPELAAQRKVDDEICGVCGQRFDAHDGSEQHRFTA